MKNLDSKSHVRGESIYFWLNQMYICDMIISEKISRTLEKLPISIQLEVLDFVEFVAHKAGKSDFAAENEQWTNFSLNQAMTGLEDEESPEYTEADLKEKWR